MSPERTGLLGLTGVLLLSAAASGGPPPVSVAPGVGYRFDGTGNFADASPVHEWDGKAGKNIVWKAWLPNWGHSSPTVFGSHVFVTCEPLDECPILVCYDIATGEKRWQREVNHLTLLPDKVQQTVRARWRECRQRDRRAWELTWQMRQAKTAAEADLVFETREKEFGYREKPHKWPSKSSRWKPDPFAKRVSVPMPHMRELKEHNLFFERWRDGGLWIGNSFPSPVTDGRHTYVLTGFCAAACYDFDGNLKWMRTLKPDAMDSSWHTQSPILVGDVMIVLSGKVLRGLDKRNGKTLWEFHWPEKHILMGRRKAGDDPVSPHYLRLEYEGEPVDAIVTFWGDVFRAQDGKRLGNWGADHPRLNTPSSPSRYQQYGIDRATNTIFVGAGATRFTMTGPEAVEAKCLWSMPGRHFSGYNSVGHVFHRGYAYAYGEPAGRKRKGVVAMDAGTGKEAGFHEGGIGGHYLVAAGDYIFGLHGNGSSVVCSPAPEMKELSRNRLYPTQPDEARRRQNIQQFGLPELPTQQGRRPSFSAPLTRSGPFVSGNRIIIRLNDCLYCIGDPDQPYRAPAWAARVEGVGITASANDASQE